MKSLLFLTIPFLAFAARPFLNEPDTGLQEFLGSDFPRGRLPNLTDLWSIHDFDWAARNFLNNTAYSWIRYGTGAEYSYQNNLEVFSRVGFKPRMLRGRSDVNMSMHTTILGYNFSAPLIISPAAAPGAVGGYVPKDRELGLLKGAYDQGILYVPALYAEMSIEEFAAAKNGTDQVTFQQLYAKENMTFNQETLDRAKAAGSKAIVWTIDAPADGAWVRGARFTIPPRTDASSITSFSWDTFDQLRNMTDLPIVLKGILNVDDAKIAVAKGADAIFLSNHGARHLDGVPSALEIALQIHDQAPEVYQQVEVYADGGVRYGSDVLKLLALGVKAVGLGRSFMYANAGYGQDGVERAIELLKKEILLDSINLGVTDLKELNSSWLDLDALWGRYHGMGDW